MSVVFNGTLILCENFNKIEIISHKIVSIKIYFFITFGDSNVYSIKKES